MPQIEQDKVAARLKAATQVQALVSKAVTQTGHAYLVTKGWPDEPALALNGPPLRIGGETFRQDDLLVPLVDDQGAVVNVQPINASGTKRMLAGGQVRRRRTFLRVNLTL